MLLIQHKKFFRFVYKINKNKKYNLENTVIFNKKSFSFIRLTKN